MNIQNILKMNPCKTNNVLICRDFEGKAFSHNKNLLYYIFR